MKIFSILVVKDESDIVQYTIDKALAWSDYIFVIDNMSTDGTWELINDVYKGNPKIVIWGRYGAEYSDPIQQLAFNQYRHMMSYGDWICKLDGDEVYIDNPKEFLASLPANCDHVNSMSHQFYFTEKDYDYELKNGYNTFDNRLQYYLPDHGELRFVKYNKYTYWLQNQEWPASLMYLSRIRIRLKHFQYRSVRQIAKRVRSRISHSKSFYFVHEREEMGEWYRRRFNYQPTEFESRNRIVPSHLLRFDNGNYENFPETYPQVKFHSRVKKIICSRIYSFFFDKTNRYRY